MQTSFLKLERIYVFMCTQKRFPRCYEIDWKSRIIEVTESFVVLDKPAGTSVGGTVDNIEESCARFATRALGLKTPLKTIRLIIPQRAAWFWLGQRITAQFSIGKSKRKQCGNCILLFLHLLFRLELLHITFVLLILLQDLFQKSLLKDGTCVSLRS